MSLYDIQELKRELEEKHNSKQRLRDSFLEFRGGFIDALKQLSDDAEKINLQGFKPLIKEAESQQITEYSMRYNDFDLSIISTGDIYCSTDIDGDPLASHIFIYTSLSTIPHMDIEFFERKQGHFGATIRWFTQKEPKPIGGMPTFGPKDARTHGREFLIPFLRHMNSLNHYWIGKPTIEALRQRKSATPIGFNTEELGK